MLMAWSVGLRPLAKWDLQMYCTIGFPKALHILFEGSYTIELTSSMIAVNNLESAVNPLPFLEMKKKTKKSQTGHIQPTVTGFHSPLDDGTRKSQPLTKVKPTNAKDAEGNTQPVGIGLSSTPLDEVTSKSKPFLKGKTTDPKDSEGNKKPDDMGLPYTVLDEGISKTKPLPEGANIKDKNSERFKPFTNMKSSTPPVTIFSGTNAKYQLLITVADIQALLEEDKLLEESYDDVFEAEEEMDEDIQEPDTKETQTHHSTERTTEEPISIEH
ncbi:hypothetical protein Tco_0088020 [Tanacetum coccineum]